MSRMVRYGLLVLVLAFGLAACGTPQTTSPVAEQPTEAAMVEQPTEAAMVEQPTEAAVAREPWQTIPLTDVRSGETFTLADFAGRPVYIETMATWCSNCRTQLTSVQEAIAALQAESPVIVAISVETDLPTSQLAQYATDNGFDMRFVVASPELLRALADTFGRTITNPPSTPHFVIAPDGSFGELRTGFSSAEQVVELLKVTGGA